MCLLPEARKIAADWRPAAGSKLWLSAKKCLGKGSASSNVAVLRDEQGYAEKSQEAAARMWEREFSAEKSHRRLVTRCCSSTYMVRPLPSSKCR